MNNFLTWDTLLTFSGLVGTVYMVVEFTKGMKYPSKMKTQYWSYLVALFLLVAVNLATGQFAFRNILLYLLNAITVSLSANGLSDFNSTEDEGIPLAPTDHSLSEAVYGSLEEDSGVLNETSD